MEDHELPQTIEPAPEIIVTRVDGFDIHTEAATQSTDIPSALVNAGASPTAMDTLYDLANGHEAMELNLPAGASGGQETQYESPKSELWNKETPDQARIITLEADIERMMDRFDELREQCRLYAEQRDEAQSQASSLQKRFERVLDECRQAKADKYQLKSELDKMKMPALPDENHEEYVKTENVRLKTELEKAKKSMESKMQDFEFVRQQYQQSSTAAADLANDNAALKDEVERLKNQMEGGLGYKIVLHREAGLMKAIEDQLETSECRNTVLIEQVRRMKDDKLIVRGRENRRDLTAHERERKRAISASDVGHRKKD